MLPALPRSSSKWCGFIGSGWFSWRASAPRLFGRVAARHEPEAKLKGVSLVTSIASGAEILYGDALRLEQALQNLAANALRHTLPGGDVELRAELSGPEVRLSIRYTGPAFRRNTFRSCSIGFTRLIRREPATPRRAAASVCQW